MPGTEKRPAYSVVVLCYRAGSGVRPFLREVIEVLEAEHLDWELVLVANYHEGTDDETPAVARELAASNARIKAVANPKQGMMGWDLRSGLAAATGDVIAFIDGDGQMQAHDLLRAYHVLKTENCDLVMTYRVARGDGAYRAAISRAYNTAFARLFPGLDLRDVNSKPKLLTREAYERMHLTSDDWFIDAEIAIHARRLGLEIRQIPTEFRALLGRKSFVKPSAIVEFVKNLARARAKEFFE
jgi:glycosyltransferase involved in cell wall biosynthesis